MHKTVFIMQGAAAAGKSTIVEALEYTFGIDHQVVVVSADNYWRQSGEYNFDIKKLGEAHQWAQRLFSLHLDAGADIIIVDNTNTTQKEAQPYINMANNAMYEIRVIRVDCSVSTCLYYNEKRPENRRVPRHIVEKMHKRLERIDPNATT